MLIKAAKEWGFLPTSLIAGEQNRAGRPGEWDLLLAEAEVLVELERCKQCGQPRYVCQSDDPDIAFEIREEVCYATQARAKAEKTRNKGKKPEDVPAGVMLGTEPYTYSQTPLEELRNPFYEQKAKDREAKVELRPVIPRENTPE